MALPVEDWVAGLLGGDRMLLSRAITLVESERSQDIALAQQVLAAVVDRAGRAHRVAVTGPPGAGKSSLIEVLGLHVIEQRKRVAVLAVDPSSPVTGGSILGDKTRMTRLSQEENAFIRPSPTATVLGGVARRTQETILLCEAAGFDVVFIETVGVGQSETAVSSIADTVLALMLSGAGDELQGIKRGLLETADIVAINKADGDGLPRAKAARAELAAALRMVNARYPDWERPVLTTSAKERTGIADLWAAIESHRAFLDGASDRRPATGAYRQRWMWAEIERTLLARFRSDPDVVAALPEMLAALDAGRITPTEAAAALLAARAKD